MRHDTPPIKKIVWVHAHGSVMALKEAAYLTAE
jgi:hypothetical protein